MQTIKALVVLLLMASVSRTRADEPKLTPDEASVVLRRAGVSVAGTSVSMRFMKKTPAKQTLAAIANLEKVTHVVIVGTNTADILAAMPDVEGVEELIVQGALADKDIAHLSKFPHLKKLHVVNPDPGKKRLTDKCLSHLEGHKELEAVNLTATLVTDAGIEMLYKALPKCVVTAN